ncbi:12773_t:CDS:1, partial [Cetraspora pellucida]
MFSYKQALRHVSLNGIHIVSKPQRYLPLDIILKKLQLTLILSGSSSNIRQIGLIIDY